MDLAKTANELRALVNERGAQAKKFDPGFRRAIEQTGVGRMFPYATITIKIHGGKIADVLYDMKVAKNFSVVYPRLPKR